MLRDALFRRALLGADVLAVVSAFAATLLVHANARQGALLCLAELPILVVVAKLLGLYDRDETLLHKTTLDEAPKLFQLATMSALLAWLVGGTFGAHVDRHQVAVLWLSLSLLLLLTRCLARFLAMHLAPPERCLFVGDRDSAERVRAKLEGGRGMRGVIVAHVDFNEIARWSADARTSSRLEEVRELAQKLDVHRAIVAPRSADGVEVLDLVRTLKALGVRVSMLPRLLEVIGSSVEFDDLHGITVMGVRGFEMTRSTAAVKRCFDIVFASVGLLVISPVLALAAIAIRLDSRGSAFFRQARVGRHGTRFHILKLRTMVLDAESMKETLRESNEAMGMFKIADDPRITRVGKLLRKTALDELPQLLNVLKGEMSVVGPRPLVLEEDERVEGWHRRRLELTPGMTGPWQILGPVRVPLSEMVSIDYLYIANWSLWNDMKIILRTVSYVIGCRGV